MVSECYKLSKKEYVAWERIIENCGNNEEESGNKYGHKQEAAIENNILQKKQFRLPR